MKKLLEFVRERDRKILKEELEKLPVYKKFLSELKDIETFFYYLTKKFNLLKRYYREGDSPEDILTVKSEIAEVIQDNINEFRSINFNIGTKQSSLGDLILDFLENNLQVETVYSPDEFYSIANSVSELISDIRSEIQDNLIRIKGDYKKDFGTVQSSIASEKEDKIREYYTTLEKLPTYRKEISDLEKLFEYLKDEAIPVWRSEISRLRYAGKFPDRSDISVQDQRVKTLEARDEIINLIKDHMEEFENIDFSIDMEEQKKKDYLRNFLLQNSDPNTILPPVDFISAIDNVIRKMLLHARKKVKTLSIELKDKINALM